MGRNNDNSETLWLVMARTCNLACDYCYQGGDHSAQRVHGLGLETLMSKAVLDKALPWAIEWTGHGRGNGRAEGLAKQLGSSPPPPPGGKLKVALYGGEPLLASPLIREIVPEWKAAFKAAGKEITFSATTNGTLLNESMRAFFKEQDVGILLSLDGPEERHNASRPKVGGGPSWADIDPVSILKWRGPRLEIAWQLDPRHYFEADDIDRMLALGFKNQNYNLNWLEPWPDEARLRLQDFAKRAARRMSEGKLASYWHGRYMRAGTEQRMTQPCGLATHMLALTPEGYLYPSQEMAFTAFEPERAKGTAEHYRVGDVGNDPVLDQEALTRVGQIQTKDMKPPPPYDCDDCVAKATSIGGCHCRYIGQKPDDPSYRYDVPVGYCQSMRAMITGLMQGYWVERKLTPPTEATPVQKVKGALARHIGAQQAVKPNSHQPKPAPAPGPSFERIPDVVHIKVG